MELSHKVVVTTDASAGIGRATAQLFTRQSLYWPADPAKSGGPRGSVYLGYANGTLAALKRMLPRNRGVIIQNENRR